MSKSGQPHTTADRGGQRAKSKSKDGTAKQPDSDSSMQPSATQSPPAGPGPDQPAGANASPVPGKDERRNRSI